MWNAWRDCEPVPAPPQKFPSELATCKMDANG
jgi:hypothetical protein